MWCLAAMCIPWDNKRKKRVALIRRQTRCPRPPSGKWCLPGGVVELSEQPVEAAARETKEESGIDVQDFRLSMRTLIANSGRTVKKTNTNWNLKKRGGLTGTT